MRLFLKKILYSILLILLVATMLQLLLTYRQNGRSVTGHEHFHAIINKNYDILFLGNSRCAHGFDPAIFKKYLNVSSFNLGMCGHGEMSMQTLRLTDYMVFNEKPKIVILNVDPLTGTSSSNNLDNRHLDEKPNYSRYAFWMEEDSKMVSDYFHFDYMERYIPLYAIVKYKLFFNCIAMTNGKIWLKDNGLLKNDSTQILHSTVDSIYKNNFWSYSHFLESYDTIKVQLDSFNALCKKNNINLICTSLPISDPMYSKEYFDKVGQMCRDLNIPFFDYGQNVSFNKNMRNFSDHLHLNILGADKFCTQLCNDSNFVKLVKQRISSGVYQHVP